jgi:hypothetical protein
MQKFLCAGLLMLLLTACNQKIIVEKSNLPVIKIDTRGEAIPDDPKILADMGIIDNGGDNDVNAALNAYDGAVGHSVGASYSTSLGCLRGDKIRAVAALGGGISADGCSSKVAAMILHNPEDNLVPFTEGERARDTFLEQNGLPLGPAATEPEAFNCSRYGSAETLYPVVWCLQPVSTESDGSYYPHTWPDGLGAAVMTFFEGFVSA